MVLRVAKVVAVLAVTPCDLKVVANIFRVAMGTLRIPFGGEGWGGDKEVCLERLSMLAKLFYAFVFRIEQVLGDY